MTRPRRNHVERAADYWSRGQPLKAGALIFENLPKEVQPKWAAGILRLVVERTGVHHPAIDHLLNIAEDPSKWGEGHRAFDALGHSTFELAKIKPRSDAQILVIRVLSLAENVAGVIYNATDPDDPFDEDRGWWIPVNLMRVLDHLNDGEFGKKVWAALASSPA